MHHSSDHHFVQNLNIRTDDVDVADVDEVGQQADDVAQLPHGPRVAGPRPVGVDAHEVAGEERAHAEDVERQPGHVGRGVGVGAVQTEGEDPLVRAAAGGRGAAGADGHGGGGRGRGGRGRGRGGRGAVAGEVAERL